jgi:hypothetical protein
MLHGIPAHKRLLYAPAAAARAPPPRARERHPPRPPPPPIDAVAATRRVVARPCLLPAQAPADRLVHDHVALDPAPLDGSAHGLRFLHATRERRPRRSARPATAPARGAPRPPPAARPRPPARSPLYLGAPLFASYCDYLTNTRAPRRDAAASLALLLRANTRCTCAAMRRWRNAARDMAALEALRDDYARSRRHGGREDIQWRRPPHALAALVA